MTEQKRDEWRVQPDKAELTVAELEAITGGKESHSKLTFNPFSITRKIDKATSIFF